ncbi:MAG: cytochrome P450 [Acidimicrobiales bacterium]
MTAPGETAHSIGTWALAREAYRSKHLRQALFDGSVVMDDVLINLHGQDHRDRRRIENPLFRRDVQLEYERSRFPAVLEETLAPHLEDGRCELMNFAHRAMLNLSCINAGIDRTLTGQETDRLLELLSEFIEGARIRHYQGDLETKVAEIAAAVAAFEAEFVEPSRLRRAELVARGEELPPDILSRLVAHTDLDPSTMAREVAFYLTAGASTSAVALTNTFDNLFRLYWARPDDLGRLADNPAMVRRCIHESLRLSPISPIGGRRATADFVFSDGTRIVSGERVDIDIRSANRDSEVFGPTADEFDPDRALPDGVPLHGFSFGHGMHHCIGAELAGGVDPELADGFDQRLLGLVGVVVQELLKVGVRLDPDDPPEIEDTTARRAFRRFPVLIG